MNPGSGEIMIIHSECWQCKKPILIALSGDDVGNLHGGPNRFSETERKLVEGRGVLLKMVSNKTAGESCVANVCGSCEAPVGEWYFFAHYYTPALYGHYKYERFNEASNAWI